MKPRQNILFGLSDKVVSDKDIMNTIKISNHKFNANYLMNRPKISEKDQFIRGKSKNWYEESTIFNPEI